MTSWWKEAGKVDGRKQEVNSREKVMHIEMSDLSFWVKFLIIWVAQYTFRLQLASQHVSNVNLPFYKVCCCFMYNCLQGAISWIKHASHVTAYNISLPSVSMASNYIFGISAENHLKQRTGIVWSSSIHTVHSGMFVSDFWLIVKWFWTSKICFKQLNDLVLKPGFHYPSWRAELTGRQLGPWTWVVKTGLYSYTLKQLCTMHTVDCTMHIVEYDASDMQSRVLVIVETGARDNDENIKHKVREMRKQIYLSK